MIEVKTRGFHQDQDPIPGPSKVGYMRATDFSNYLQDNPSAEAGSIYATKSRLTRSRTFTCV